MTTHDIPFVCKCCGACCRWPGIVRVSDEEIRAIADYLELTEDAFRDEYTRLNFDRRSLILTEADDGACIFLDANKLCRINPVKPEQCKGFPAKWSVPPEYQELCAGFRAQAAAKKRQREQVPSCGIGHIHVLGHPLLPLSVVDAPADAQVFTCHNFCLLLDYLHIPYTYYGISGSQLPGQGQFADCGRPTGSWKYGNRWHKTYTQRLNRQLAKRLDDTQGPELICSLYGAAQADIEAADRPLVEPLLGYDHCWAPYRVFPSYAHQHVIYTKQEEFTRENRFFDTIIPHFVNADDYWIAAHQEDYLLYLGRDAPDKGVHIARECAQACDMRIKCVHDNCFGADKSELIARAQAVLMPTLYVEPFGYVAIEAQLCGTPVITTDWGAFTETVVHGQTGFRCRSATEFIRAVTLAKELDRPAIRKHAREHYSIEAVAPAYAAYFDFVWNVHKNGGYYAPDALRDRRLWAKSPHL
jgi:glycosyltransferase involved in cell wall biosynthesis/Fe-S-cluster containining protein